jgi:3-keto-5-aminohexanoate cleavage enzyme
MSEPVMIELRANESAQRAGRPHLPLTPEEIVADAVSCEAAGASILHWHARDPSTGATTTDADLNGRIARDVRRSTELVLHPTLGGAANQDAILRTAHVAALNADPLRRFDLVPIDFGSMNIDLWDDEVGGFRTEDRVYLNPRRSLRLMLETSRSLSVGVVSVCWNVGQIRTARRFQEQGLLGWTLWELVFTGDAMPDGMAPTRRGLEAMVEQVPSGQPWSVACIVGDVLGLATWAIELGGHVSVGLGDWPYRQLGSPTNADIVAHVAGLVTRAGRPVATPRDARELLHLPSPERQIL